MDETPWPAEFEKVLRGHLPLLSDAALEPTTDLAAVGLDSLSTVALLVELEETFAVAVPDERLTADGFRTAQTLWNMLAGLEPDGD